MRNFVSDFFLWLIVDWIVDYCWCFAGKFTDKLLVHLTNGDDLVTLAEDPQTYCPVK
jgi:hypothetical protein